MTKTPPVCNYEGSDYQSSFWDRGGRAYEDSVEEIALKRLLTGGGKLMLELGAGAGRNTRRYAGFERVVLLDYSRSQLEQAQKRLSSSEDYVFVTADVYKLPFQPGLFDGATMIRTLHHMAEPSQALQQVRRVLQKNAIFILEYANKQNLKAIFRYLAGRQSWSPFSEQAVEFAELNFDFHPRSIQSMLAENQFVSERLLTVSHFRMSFFKKFFPLKLLVAMDSMAQLTGNAWQLSPSVFVKARAVGAEFQSQNDLFFQCPRCGAGIEDNKALAPLVCSDCGQVYPHQDGIYDFRIH